jgi:hypothetical protein
MWQSGALTADALFCPEGSTEWKELRLLAQFLEPEPSASMPPPSRQVEPSPTYQPTSLEILQIQSKLKSKSTAALLAVFLPFVGGCYASIGGSISIVVIGVVGILQWGKEIGDYWPAAIGVLYIVSIFHAITSVNEYNAALLASLSPKPKEEPAVQKPPRDFAWVLWLGLIVALALAAYAYFSEQK